MSDTLKLLGHKRQSEEVKQLEKIMKIKEESKRDHSESEESKCLIQPVIDYFSNDNPNIQNNNIENSNSTRKASLPFQNKLNPRLPIYQYAGEINDLIKSNQVIVLAGRTGCGKTTQVPQIIYQNGEYSHTPVKILITQPRRIAAVSIAKRLSFELRSQLGDLVGYHVGMNPYYNSEKTKIVIKTTGIFLEELIHEKTNMNNYTHLILDEVHERDINIDFVLVLVKHFLKKNTTIKLILMSATISTDLFAKYFSKTSIMTITENNFEYDDIDVNNQNKNGNENDNINNFEWNAYCPIDDEENNLVEHKPIIELTDDCAPVLEIKHQVFQLYSFYLETITQHIKAAKVNQLKHLTIKNFAFSFSKKQPLVNEDLFVACLDLIECIHFKLVNPKEKINNSVLIFLPGLGEILSFMSFLKEHFSKIQEIEILMLHSNISDEEQEKVFIKTSKRKIILATNIAESSITIDDTCYVIDFCLVKELQYNCKTMHEALELKWASKANCLQRAGRAGRTSIGYVFRLINSKFFDCLDDFPSPEILRCPLEKVILKIKVYDCGEPSVILGRSIQPPELKNINSAINNLKNCGALTVEDPNSPTGKLTELGKVYAELPIDIKYSRLIMLSYAFGLTEAGIISSAILSQEKRFFKIYNNSRRDLYKVANKFSMGSECDVISSYNAFKAWEKEFGFKLRRNQYDRKVNRWITDNERKWCIKHCLDTKLLREILTLSADIKKRLSMLNVYEVSNNDNDNQDLDFKNEATMNLFKYILTGAFYGKVIKSKFNDIDKIKRLNQKSQAQVNCFEYTSTIFVRGIPLNVNEHELRQLFNSFGTITYFDYTSQEARIGFDATDYKRAIKLILFIGSNSVFQNHEFEVTLKQNDGQDISVFLRKPDYLFELIHFDLFSGKKVEIQKESINHVVIENDFSVLPLICHVCDEYLQKETKWTARYVTKLPEKPMVDLILTLIFSPYARFYPNEAKNQYKSFKVVGNETEFILSYLFSSIDVKEINAIRRILNKLVKTKEAYQTDFSLLRKQLIENINAIVNKKRIKIISRDHWNRLFFKFYPELKISREAKMMFYSSQDNEEDDQRINNKIGVNLSFLANSKGSNDFLEPLVHLNIKEDLRLWTPQGLNELELERKKFNTMREELIERLSTRKNYINHTEPELCCAGCNSFICAINNIKEEVIPGLGKLFRIHLWGSIRDILIDSPLIQSKTFLLEWENNFKHAPDAYLQCFESSHIIGVKIKNNYYVTHFSDLCINLPGEILMPWNEKAWGNDFKGMKEELAKAKVMRENYIEKELECELCNFHCTKENDYLAHLKSKDHVNLLKELQEEIF